MENHKLLDFFLKTLDSQETGQVYQLSCFVPVLLDYLAGCEIWDVFERVAAFVFQQGVEFLEGCLADPGCEGAADRDHC